MSKVETKKGATKKDLGTTETPVEIGDLDNGLDTSSLPFDSNDIVTELEPEEERASKVDVAADQNKKFGLWLRQQLKEQGVSQVELARRIGKTYVHVRRVVNGYSGTKRGTVVAIAYALDIPVIDAIRAAFGQNVSAREGAIWRKLYEELPPEEKSEIDDYIMYRYSRWVEKMKKVEIETD